MKRILVIGCIVSLAMGSIWTPVDTHITDKTIWPAVDADTLLVDNDVLIDDGAELIILPSNQGNRFVYFAGQKKIIVNGCIIARGRKNNQIVFTGNSIEYIRERFIGWGGIRIDKSPSGNNGRLGNNKRTVFEFCRFEHANSNLRGGAIYVKGFSRLQIKNCVFRNNMALSGAGIYLLNSSPDIINCSFEKNICKDSGGALYIDYNSSPRIANCRIIQNEVSGYGGGIYFDRCSAEIQNTLIADNTALRGGGICQYGSAVNFTNCTVVNNDAIIEGSGSYLNNSYSTVNNSIFWGNNSDDFQLTGGSESKISHSAIEENKFANNRGCIDLAAVNISLNGPGFKDPENGDYNLLEHSICIDKGNKHKLNHDMLTDLNSYKRSRTDTPDLGACEFSVDQMSSFLKLSEFTVAVENACVKLRWDIADAQAENICFFVYRNEKVIASVATRGSGGYYEFTDDSRFAGQRKYMISSFDDKGRENKYDDYAVDIDISEYDLAVWDEKKNPSVISRSAKSGDVQMRIYSVKGRHLATLKNNRDDDSSKLKKELGTLSNGMYLMKIVDREGYKK